MSEENPEQSLKVQFREEDGELILSDNENQDEKPGESPDRTNSRKSRRKQTFERRNIKKVREDGLSEEAKAAQKAEMERRQRLVSKDKGEQVKFSNIDFLLNDSSSSPDFLKCSDVNFQSELQETGSFVKKEGKYDSDAEECNSLENGSTVDSQRSSFETGEKGAKQTISNTLTNGGKQSPSNESDQKRAVGSASAALFGSTWSDLQSFRMGQSHDDPILLGDSDDDQHTDSGIIEVSDGEDEPEMEVEAEICEIQDADNLADIDGKIVINPSRDQDEEPEIVLCPQMARVIKPHQVSGIRFLYDNVVESVKRFHTTDGFGCILAHSMGLGKTIQIIGFLDILFRFCQAQRVLVIVPINTIQNWQAEFELWLPTDLSSCAANKKSKFFQRFSVPKPTTESKQHPSFPDRTDSSADPNVPLVDSKETDANMDDQMLWSSMFENDKSESQPKVQDVSHNENFYGEPNDSEYSFVNNGSCLRPFKLFVVRDTVKTMSQRHQIIQQWFEEGGVLLLGYEMFRLLLNQKRLNPPPLYTTKVDVRIPKRRKKDICIDIEKEEKREKMWADFHTALLDPGPQLVICDEGHRIKNSEASISKALKAIKTHRRVVLTGYPLQNNLMEYWCMVDFVRPNYLGTKQEFTNMFQRPIENGQCIDSTPEDRKVMQGRAHVLHDLLSGFVQRRSHAVLKASLPPKTEIVLLIKLSSLQRTLYAAFMRSLGSSGPLGWAQVNTLKTYAMCCKIWNHPDILRRAMEEHKEAMDFDIEETTANNNSNTTMSSTGRPPYQRPNSTIPTSQNESQQSWVSGGDSTSISSDLTSGQLSTSTINNSTYSGSDSSTPLSFMAQNPMFPTSTAGGGTPSNTGQSNNLPNPGYFYTQNYAHQPSVGTYDWAGDQELWGDDFKAGNVEHSGKVLLFLDILKGSVLAGDKLLVFTQSLYTLDLLERILRHLPLPVGGVDKSETVPSKSSEIPSEDTGKFETSSYNPSTTIQKNDEQNQDDHKCNESGYGYDGVDHFHSNQPDETMKEEGQGNSKEEIKNKTEREEEEETPKSLHYRLSTRRGCLDEPTVWTRNVHYFRLDGSTNASEREKLINNFNDPKNPAKLFLMSTRAGCLGVNLIGANRVVVFDASWNPCHDCQAVCRVYRYGQVKPCYIYRLVSDNTMEKKIYDRQVTKQGMSDRVVDELNPTQQFTRSQVELLMSFEDKDMETISDEDLEICKDIIQPDPILADVLKKHTRWITKRPFTHESLLIDRKDYRLTRVEKRMARQRYEQEKRLSLSYQQAHLFQLQQMQILQQQQLLAAGINPALVDTSRFYNSRTPNILSRSTINYRPTYTSGMAALDAMRQVDRQARLRMLQKDLDEARRRCGYAKPDGLSKIMESPDCKVTRIVANTDLFFPSTTNATTTQRKIPKGEVLEVIQTPKAKYLRISRTGDLFIVKTSGTTNSNSLPTENNTVSLDEQENTTTTTDKQKAPSDTVNSNTTCRNSSNNLRSTVATTTTTTTTSTTTAGSADNTDTTLPGTFGSSYENNQQHSQTRQKSSYSTNNSDSNISSYDNLNNKSENNVPNSSVTYSNSQPFNYSQSYNQSNTNIFQPFTSVANSASDSGRLGYSKDSHFLQSNVSPKRAHSSNETFTFDPGTKDTRQSYDAESSNYQHQMLNRHDTTTSSSSGAKEDHNNTSITYPNQTFSSQDPFRAHVQRTQQVELSWPCSTCGRTISTGCTCRLNSSNINPSVRTISSSPAISDPNAQSSRFRPFTNCTAPSESFQSDHANNKKNFPSSVNYQTTVSVPYYQTQNVPSSSASSSSALSSAHRQLQQHQYLRTAEDVARQSALSATVSNITNPSNSSYQSTYQNPTRINNVNNDNSTTSVTTTTNNNGNNNHAQHPNLSSGHHQVNTLQSHVSMMQDYFTQLTNQRPQLSSSSCSLDLQRAGFGGEQTPSHAVAAAMQQYLAQNSQNHMNIIKQNNNNNNSAHNHQTSPERNLSNLRTSFDPTVHYQQFQLAAAAKEQQQQHQSHQQQLLLQQRQQQQQQNIGFVERSQSSHHHNLPGPTVASVSSSPIAAASSSMFNHLHSQAFPNFHFPQF
uniref:Helicase ARIP4 n=1 Tax=Schistosoma mansoni TaxID=6183 RepID=A0A3Q0KBG6_SCHMA